MNTIQNYLDNMFVAYPQTYEVQKAKSELMSMMEDKYNELKAEGKSENEAIGIVISEFGNIDELMGEFRVESEPEMREAGRQSSGAVDPSVYDRPYVDIQTAEEFIAAKRSEAVLDAIGVALCILSPCWVISLSVIPWSFFSNLGVVLLLITVAVAVGAFILGEYRVDHFKYMKKPFYLSLETEQWIMQERVIQKENGRIFEIIGIIAFVTSPIGVILFSDVPVINSIAPIFVLISVAIGVFLCVYASGGEDACKKMLKKGRII